jgi:hypothetical protein
VEPSRGTLDDAFSWRARRYASVNAASPVLCGENRVLVTQSYIDRDHEENGAVLLEYTAEKKWKPLWKAESLGCHWMTPVAVGDHLYAFIGEKENACDIACYEVSSGKQLWKQRPEWPLKLRDSTVPTSFKRGSLLHVDGRFLCLGEWGALAWLDLGPSGLKILSQCQLFTAQQTWTLPAISQGLLYVLQSQKDEVTGTPPRLICYDLRAE